MLVTIPGVVLYVYFPNIIISNAKYNWSSVMSNIKYEEDIDYSAQYVQWKRKRHFV